MGINDALKAFHNDYIIDAYNYFGSFYTLEQTTFRVYAPHAFKVAVIGDFNNWDENKSVMNNIGDGVYEITIENVKMYDAYKYRIFSENKVVDKADPYAIHSETNGKTASKIYDAELIKIDDEKWIKKRSKCDIYHSALNIYELNLGSWRRNENGDVLSYKMIADELIPYVKKMGYTHIELMPVTEYPYDGSWGYQVTGYYSITSRYGTPADFAYLIELAHKNNIGVILDWVPAHFPKDDFGLVEFDGNYLYEDPAPTRMEHKTWGTRIFNYAKPEVKSFLISSANHLFKRFHVDGLRVDAVAAMIYLDYDREEWIPNKYGGNYNLEAIEFIKNLNQSMFSMHKGIMMIAEESTAFPMVTHPVYLGGLGFNFKWSMGWMNDTLSYMKCNPLFRKYDHNKMTFASVYCFSENFILPLSHDEVVHGKCSLLNKMPGEYDEKFDNLRVYLGYMMTHPGKKLNFMGYEFGQFIEWNYKKELDWLLLEYPKHKMLNKYVEDLNNFYINHSELYEIDDSWDGFNWINANDGNNNVYTYKRMNKLGSTIYIALNFSGRDIDYIINGVPQGKYKEIFNSDLEIYGGKNVKNKKTLVDDTNNLKIIIPKFSILMFKREEI